VALKRTPQTSHTHVAFIGEGLGFSYSNPHPQNFFTKLSHIDKDPRLQWNFLLNPNLAKINRNIFLSHMPYPKKFISQKNFKISIFSRDNFRSLKQTGLGQFACFMA